MSDTAGALQAHFALEYPYSRSVGAVLERYLRGLGERRIHGIRTESSGVVVPPQEYDPQTSASLGVDDLVEVGDAGVVTTWSWNATPKDGQPLDRPFAWALIRLDGADMPMLHAVAAASPDAMATGMRVRARWADEPVADVAGLVCFDPEEAS